MDIIFQLNSLTKIYIEDSTMKSLNLRADYRNSTIRDVTFVLEDSVATNQDNKQKKLTGNSIFYLMFY